MKDLEKILIQKGILKKGMTLHTVSLEWGFIIKNDLEYCFQLYDYSCNLIITINYGYNFAVDIDNILRISDVCVKSAFDLNVGALMKNEIEFIFKNDDDIYAIVKQDGYYIKHNHKYVYIVTNGQEEFFDTVEYFEQRYEKVPLETIDFNELRRKIVFNSDVIGKPWFN